MKNLHADFIPLKTVSSTFGLARCVVLSSMAILSFGLLSASADTFTLVPSADLYTGSTGSVTSLTNRLLVGSGDISYLTFDLSSLESAGYTTADIMSATLEIYLVNPNSNYAATVTATDMSATAAAAMKDDGSGPAAGAAYAPTLGSLVASDTITNITTSHYETWNVTSLVTGVNGFENSTGTDIVGFAMKEPSGSLDRFTDRDPANDGSPSNAGFTPELIIVTPEPSSIALMMAGGLGLFLTMMIRRFKSLRS